MFADSYEDWISIYNDDLKSIWQEERKELRKVSMIYHAFEKELNSLKNTLTQELTQIKSELKKKDRLKKCRNFKGLAQTEGFDDILIDKENAMVNLTEKELLIESPDTLNFFQGPPSAPSPVFNQKRKQNIMDTTPKFSDETNVMESSIIEDTPEEKPVKRNKLSLIKSKQLKPNKRSNQMNTLTQMFFDTKKPTKQIDSNLPSMGITEMIKLINDSDSETASELDQLDETASNLVPVKSPLKDCNKAQESEPIFVYNEVVRGKARKKLKGWSCRECQDYYGALNLPPDELQKKMNECSRHRFRFKSRQETHAGFWDLTFGPTPKTQESEKSLVFNYKRN